MLNSLKIQALLQHFLKPVSLDEPISFKTSPLQSVVLISSLNGAIISYANSDESNTSINNLKMVCLLCKDRWSEDESNLEEQSTKCCYRYQWQVNNGKPYETRIYTYEIEEMHVVIAHIPESDLIVLFTANKDDFPYGLMVLKMKHTLQAISNLYGYRLS